MEKSVHYTCPKEGTCTLHKHCHVLKTAKPLEGIITAFVKCPAQKNKEIPVCIGEAMAQKNLILVTHR